MIINGILWSIIFTNNINDLRRDDGTIALGICDKAKRTIYISDSLYGDLLKDVIIHEICHAFIFSYSYYIEEEEEEFICQFVSRFSNDILWNAEGIYNKAMDYVKMVK